MLYKKIVVKMLYKKIVVKMLYKKNRVESEQYLNDDCYFYHDTACDVGNRETAEKDYD